MQKIYAVVIFQNTKLFRVEPKKWIIESSNLKFVEGIGQSLFEIEHIFDFFFQFRNVYLARKRFAGGGNTFQSISLSQNTERGDEVKRQQIRTMAPLMAQWFQHRLLIQRS
jgi:hypothetical protein